MPTSGVYTFAPEIAEICDEAFERCGVDPASLLNKHVISARRSLNYVFTMWSNRKVNLWAIAQSSVSLVSGLATYAFETSGIAMLDAVIRDPNGKDSIIVPFGREDYINLPDKNVKGVPAQYWFERVLAPIIHLYPVIDSAGYSLIYNYMQQIQSPGVASNTLGIPQIWQEAIVSALAAKLAEKYSPEREAALLSKAELRFKEAKSEDRERFSTTFTISKYRGR